MQNEIFSRQVIDSQSGAILRTYSAEQAKPARRLAEKKNMEYGAHRYTVKLVWKF